MDRRREDIVNAVKDADQGNGVIILTDMFGGTPSNLSISVMDSGQIEVIAGINLPMLIKLARVREDNDMQKSLQEAQDAGQKYINVASSLLSGK
jgi:PTS system mannose-specific IIA component